MRTLARGFALLAAGMLVVACGGGSPTAAPATNAPVATTGATTAATAAPPTTAPATTAAETSCHTPDASEATVVQADVAGFEWGPVNAKVGDVITWSNGDSAPHGVKTDDGSCRMEENIAGGGTGSLVFDKAGTYPFTCTVHGNMKGTITITE
jgi:plastocyanin